MSLTDTEELLSPPAPQDTEAEPPALAAPETQDTPADAPQIDSPAIEAEPVNDTSTPINPWDSFNDTIDGLPESADSPADPVDDASQSPPDDTDKGDKGADDKLPGETDSDHVQRLLVRYNSDPVKMATALLNLRRKVTEQGNELSRRNGTASEPVVPAEARGVVVEPPGSGVPQTPSIPETLSPVNVELPGANIRPEDIYNPETWNHNEETGWPVDDEGDDVWPVDEFGIKFTPQSVWDKRAELLEEEIGSTRAVLKVQEERQADIARYQAEYREKFAVVSNYQMQTLKAIEPELAKVYTNYEEPVAKAFAFEIAKAAYEEFQRASASGELNRQQMKNPETVKQIADLIQFRLYKSGKTDEYAEVLRKSLPKATEQSNAAAQQRHSPPPGGGSNGGSAPAALLPTAKVEPKAKAIADKTGLDPSEVAKFKQKDFTFELN